MAQLIKNNSLTFHKKWVAVFSYTIFILINSLSLTHAGFDKGNGGDGFNCSDPENSFFLAEEIESLPMWGLKTIKYTKNNQKNTHPYSVIKKISSLYPQLAKNLEEDLAWVESNLKLIDNVDLVDLDDDLLAWIPKNCDLVQLALQTPTDVFVVQFYWKKMNPIQKAMLLTHEAIYRNLDRLARKQNVKLQNSIGVRLLNAFIWQEDLSKHYSPMTHDQLKLAISKLKLPNLHTP